MRKRFLLYGHGGSYNHGAEAIVRTTIKMIRDKYHDAYITLSTHFPEQDKEFALETDEIIGPEETIWGLEKKTTGDQERLELARKMYAEALGQINGDTVCLSVGGDVFCYNNWHRLAVFQDKAAEVGAKTILWGCSIEPSAITPEMLNVLRTYTHIIARESLTFNALCRHGLTEKLLLAPDTAFFLEQKQFKLSESLLKNNVVGINISPLIIRKETKPGIIIENIKTLIKWIIEQTNYNIMLIPHVMQSADNDHALLFEIFNEFSDDYRQRIYLLDRSHQAAEYKYAVSKCKLIICARTHLSVAAYSLEIPALVLGYSIKSKGIAADLGMADYALDLANITEVRDIKKAFVRLQNDYDVIRARLEKKDYNKSIERVCEIL